MKIKCKPEGRENIYVPEKASLKQFIKGRKLKKIHNFVPLDKIMLGADHPVESVLKDIDEADKLAIFTDPEQIMGHSLALIKDEKLECYDIGTIKKSDLAISKAQSHEKDK